MSNFAPLTKYIPLFNADDFGKWIIDTENDGSFEHPYHLPYVDYSKTVIDFEKDLYDYCKSHPELEYTIYRETLEKNGIAWNRESMQNADLSKIDCKGVIALLIGVSRLDHFCEGAMLRFLKNGSILRWLEWLQKYDESCTRYVDNCEWVIKIEFGKCQSSSYNKAKTLAKSLPNFKITGNSVISCGTQDVIECCKYFSKFEELSQIIQHWKSAHIIHFDQEQKCSKDHSVFIETLKKLGGKYTLLLNSQSPISYEQLPLPYVYYPPIYGAFFGFSADIGEEIYFCECEREAINKYFSIREVQPLKNYSGDRINLLDSALFPYLLSKQIRINAKFLKFKPNLCFRCNHVVPRLNYCHSMYGGEFEQKHGWYIQQEYFINGIDPTRKHLGVILSDYCRPDIMRAMNLQVQLQKCAKDTDEYIKIAQELDDNGDADTLINDYVRAEFGYRGIGEHWINETTLKHIVKELFPNLEVIAHYRPSWLDGLELDIYVPEIKLAFEYQGIQHFQAVKHWGGKEKLKIQQEHDKRKKQICDNLGVTLIYFDYTEEITTEYVKTKISEFVDLS